MVNYKGTDRIFNSTVYSILFLFSAVVVFPLVFILVNSISDPTLVYLGKVILIPKDISFEAYSRVLTDPDIWTGYGNTLKYTVLGTMLSIFLTFTAAYPLSRRDMFGKKTIMFVYTLTMFINGGLIPTYLIVDGLGLTNTLWGFIIPGCLSVWNVIVVKTFIGSNIPWEMHEAAMIEGCNDFGIFLRIILPLSKPIIAVMILFYAVGYWNSYFNAIIYLTDKKLMPLQMFLRNILIGSEMSNMMANGATGAQEGISIQGQLSESLKYATIVVSSAPILFLYPFIQKYFEKGILIGSIKG